MGNTCENVIIYCYIDLRKSISPPVVFKEKLTGRVVYIKHRYDYNAYYKIGNEFYHFVYNAITRAYQGLYGNALFSRTNMSDEIKIYGKIVQENDCEITIDITDGRVYYNWL